jgi:hypothetical protein
MLNPKQIAYIQPLLAKLYEILTLRPTTDGTTLTSPTAATNEALLICTILSMGRVVHLHPQSELVTAVFELVMQVLHQAGQQNSSLLCQAVLRCILNTVRFTRIHTTTLTHLKLGAWLQALLDKNWDEKVSLACLQIIRELVTSG